MHIRQIPTFLIHGPILVVRSNLAGFIFDKKHNNKNCIKIIIGTGTSHYYFSYIKYIHLQI